MNLEGGLIANPWALVIAAGALVGSGFAAGWTAQGWRKGAEVSSLQSQAATTTSQRATVALTASEAFRGAEAETFLLRARGADAYEQSLMADVDRRAGADAADAGLLGAIETSVAAAVGGCAVPDAAAAQRASETVRALGTSLRECSARRTEVAGQLAESIRRGLRCEADYEAFRTAQQALIHQSGHTSFKEN